MAATFALLPSLLLFSCGAGDNAAADTDLYFPVDNVVNQQMDSLGKSTDVWRKTVTAGDTPEEKTVAANTLDWKAELALFSELNPNKKAYAGKFTADTAVTEDGKTIDYRSDQLKLSMLTIRLNPDESVKAIYGDLTTSNLFYDSRYQLSLVPYKAFGINGMQTLNFFHTKKEFSLTWVKQTADSAALAHE